MVRLISLLDEVSVGDEYGGLFSALEAILWIAAFVMIAAFAASGAFALRAGRTSDETEAERCRKISARLLFFSIFVATLVLGYFEMTEFEYGTYAVPAVLLLFVSLVLMAFRKQELAWWLLEGGVILSILQFALTESYYDDEGILPLVIATALVLLFVFGSYRLQKSVKSADEARKRKLTSVNNVAFTVMYLAVLILIAYILTFDRFVWCYQLSAIIVIIVSIVAWIRRAKRLSFTLLGFSFVFSIVVTMIAVMNDLVSMR
ncbi:MAG: hypothetical protein IKX54_05495 [Lachnospiraceae bacterium]|nr:hypothetical protein [Lachnospiraceae bacterium]